MNGFESALSLVEDAAHALAPSAQEIGAWFLAWVFLWSGAVKLRRPVLAAMAMVEFGVATRVRPRFGIALGSTEALIALGLASGASPFLLASLSAALLWLFVVVIARSLRSGERFACFCFGNLHSELSTLTLARTVGLALLSSALALASRETVWAGFTHLDPLHAIAGLSILGTLVLGALVPHLLSSSRDIRVLLEVGGAPEPRSGEARP